MIEEFNFHQFYADIRKSMAEIQNPPQFIEAKKLINKLSIKDLPDISYLPPVCYFGTCYLIKNKTIIAFTSTYAPMPQEELILPLYHGVNRLETFITATNIYCKQEKDVPRDVYLREADLCSISSNDQLKRIYTMMKNGFTLYYK